MIAAVDLSVGWQFDLIVGIPVVVIVGLLTLPPLLRHFSRGGDF